MMGDRDTGVRAEPKESKPRQKTRADREVPRGMSQPITYIHILVEIASIKSSPTTSSSHNPLNLSKKPACKISFYRACKRKSKLFSCTHPTSGVRNPSRATPLVAVPQSLSTNDCVSQVSQRLGGRTALGFNDNKR